MYSELNNSRMREIDELEPVVAVPGQKIKLHTYHQHLQLSFLQDTTVKCPCLGYHKKKRFCDLIDILTTFCLCINVLKGNGVGDTGCPLAHHHNLKTDSRETSSDVMGASG